MADNRNQGRKNTHDTGSPTARPRDDLRTASKKEKPNEKRDESRDREDTAQNQDNTPKNENESD
jgi:hypothetical protein